MLEAYLQLASGEAHADIAFTMGRCCNSDGARARGGGLPYSAFPHSCRHLDRARRFVRPERSCGSGTAGASRAAGRSRRSCRDPRSPRRVGCRPRPGSPTSRRSSRARRLSTSPRSCSTTPPSRIRVLTTRSPTTTSTRSTARARREPRGGDSRPISGELRSGAIRVPDRDLDPIVGHGEDFHHPVRIACERDCLARLQPSVAWLRDDVRVTERAPGRGLHQPPARPVGRRRSSRFPESASSTCAGTRRSVASARSCARAPPRAGASRARRARAP